MFERPDHIKDPLYVVTTVFNPVRYRSRWKLYCDFKRHCEAAGAILYTVEVAYGDREFAITEPGNPRHLQLRTDSELWLKENAINLGVQRLPADWRYVAWVDADVSFARSDWANETIQQLQHYDLVQMWSQYQDLTPDYEVIGTARSFMDCYLNGGQANLFNRLPQGYGHKPRHGYPGAPGLAWACRREAWDALGGLIDYAILGACDWYMAHAIVGKLDAVIRKEYHPRFNAKMKEWEKRAKKHIQGNVGVVKGLALHFWHGAKKNRFYGSRDKVLVDANFNPDTDLKRDWQMLYQLTDRSTILRDGIRNYFRIRNEDDLH